MASSSEQLLHCPAPRPMAVVDRRWRATNESAPNCPRCASSNTKFCYYNNYSLSQPRYFCKGCRRYWTKGGSLRNVPVGGGCRKSRRSRSSRSSLSDLGAGLGPRCSSDSSLNACSESSEEAAGPHIDLAAVFAKFLNNDQSSDNVSKEMNDRTNTPSEASHDSLTSSSYKFENGIETQNPSDDVLDQEFQMTEGLAPSVSKQLHEEEPVQGFTSPDLASFDHIMEDLYWSDESELSTLTWQPVAQLEDFDSPLLPIDQFKGSANLLSSDNWSYFDTTGFEAFPKP